MEYVVLFDIEDSGYFTFWHIPAFLLVVFGYFMVKSDLKDANTKNWFKGVRKRIWVWFLYTHFHFLILSAASIAEKLTFNTQVENGEYSVITGKAKEYVLKSEANNHASFKVREIEFEVGHGTFHAFSPQRHYRFFFEKHPYVRVTFNKDLHILKFEKLIN